MTKPAFTPPSQGGSYRIGKDGRAARVSFTVQRDDPAHPDHPSRRQAATAARPSSAAPAGASSAAAAARGQKDKES